MKRLLLYLFFLLSLALPLSAAKDGKFTYAYPDEADLPYNLGYQYSVYDLKESDTEGWRVMYLDDPVTLAYNITSEEDKTVEVVFDQSYLELKDIVIPEIAIDPDTHEEYKVTAIGKMAFDDCPEIRSVIMANSITRIGDYAFNMCENKVLHNIGYIKFSENLTEIGNYAFRNCHNLTTGQYTEGGQYPIVPLNFLKSVDYPVYGYASRLTGVDNYLLLPASVEYIGTHAFEGCYFEREDKQWSYGLCKVKIPNPSCEIGDYAFAGCKFLELITIGEELTGDGLTYPTPAVSRKGRIGDYAFADCNLMRLDIPSSIQSIGKNAFSNCFHKVRAKTPRSQDGRVYFDELNWFYPRSLFDNESDQWHNWNFENSAHSYLNTYDEYLDKWHTNTVTIHGENTIIGVDAFADNPKLETIIINGSVGEIGSGAFRNCPLLASVDLPQQMVNVSESMFRDCVALKNIEIPNSVREIGDAAFYNCENLEDITLPSNLEKVSPYTFYGCKWLSLAGVPDGVRSIGEHAFHGCRNLSSFDIPGSVKSIGEYAFAECYIHDGMRNNDVWTFYYGLTKVRIGDGVESIGAHAFDGCRHLGDIYFGNGIKTIGDYAFLNCMNCPEDKCSVGSEPVSLPASLISIGTGCFQGCARLSEVSLGDSMTELPDFAFAYCGELDSLSNYAGIESVGPSTFLGCYQLEDLDYFYGQEGLEDGIYYNEEGTEVISALPNIAEAIIKEGVTKICDGAFAGCGTLYYVEFPESLEVIGSRAFADCSGFYGNGYLEFPESLKEIGERAFENCISLEAVRLCNVDMGDFVYAGCTGIELVEISADFNQPLKDNWFAGCIYMSQIAVEDGNALYTDYDDTVLLDKEGTTLLRAPSGLECLELPETVTKIGEYACSNCPNLGEVIIPSTVREIGAHAFDGCVWKNSDGSGVNGITNVFLENPAVKIGEYAFNGCESLENVEWDGEAEPGTHGSIGAYAFNGCERLYFDPEALMWADISVLEPYAFANFPGLTSIELPATLETIGDHAFDSCPNLTSVVFPEGLKRIGAGAFQYSPLRSLDLPDSVEEIGDGAFMNCSNVMALKLPENLKKINPYTFYKCFSGAEFDEKPEQDFNLSVEIPGGVESIGEYAFYGCAVNTQKFFVASQHNYSDIYHFYNYGLSSLTIGDNVKTIGAHAFDGCTHLFELTIGTGVTSIGDYAFNDCFKQTFKGVKQAEYSLTGHIVVNQGSEPYTTVWDMNDTIPQPVSLPENLRLLGECAFNGCAQLPSINFPASVTDIPYHAFNGCESLDKIELPEGIRTIGESAFGGCKGVKEISIPESLENGSRVFVDCDSAYNVYYHAAVPRAFDEAFFSPKVYSSREAVINAPNALLADIKGLTPWALFYRIVAKDETLVHLERSLETKNNLRFRILSNKPVPYCEVAGPAEEASTPTSYVVPEYVLNIDETSEYFNQPYKVIRIGNDAFEKDLMLTGIEIPESVFDIGQEAFNGCKNLLEIKLPNSISNMGERAFANCYGLTYFEVPPLVTRLNNGVLKDCRGLYSIAMHDNIQELGAEALMDCRHLRAFERSENWKLQLIDDYALKNCIELEEINIPEGVKKIGKEAMYYCQKLKTVSLPKSLEELGENTFDDCEVLNTIKVYTETPPTTRGERNLTDQNCKIYVQPKSLDAYKEFWKIHEHRIEPGIIVTQLNRNDMPEYVPGSTYLLNYKMPLDGQTPTWSSTNGVVATPKDTHDSMIDINAVGRATVKVVTDQHYYHDCTLEVYPQRADANWDGGFDISDAVNIANYVVHNPEVLINWWETERTDFSDEDDWMGFYQVGADVNGDGGLSISDASAAVKIVLAQNPDAESEARAMRVRSGNEEKRDALLIGATGVDPSGHLVIPVGLDNSIGYVALQANISVPEGMTLQAVNAGPRAAGHALSTRRIDDRTMRVVLFDLDNSEFSGDGGALLELMVSGEAAADDQVCISGIVASDIASRSHDLTSRIEDISTGVKHVHEIPDNIRITHEGVVIIDAEGERVTVSEIDGTVLRSLTVGSDHELICLPKGIHIITVKDNSFKVSIK